jgi:hypothetical protein
MRNRVFWAMLGMLCLVHAGCGGKSPTDPTREEPVDYRGELQSALVTLSDQSGDPLFRLHFNSILQVVEAGDHGWSADQQGIKDLWAAFTGTSTPHSPRLRESYLDRSRPLIVSWVSPTDGQVSFAWLTLPALWDPTLEYPLYIQLHGLWDVAQDRIPYLAYPFSHPGTSYAFEDGYLISPWGRGNSWYRGIAETDIWEGMAVVKGLVQVDESRQYTCAATRWEATARGTSPTARPACGPRSGSTPEPSSTTNVSWTPPSPPPFGTFPRTSWWAPATACSA